MLDPKNILAVDLGDGHITITVLLRSGVFMNPIF
jgi:hypothetical protein